VVASLQISCQDRDLAVGRCVRRANVRHRRTEGVWLMTVNEVSVDKAPAGSPVVHIPEGRLRGAETDGVLLFRGVPYAAPPVGPLRFRPPQPPIPWTGLREALDFGAVAVQTSTPLEERHGTGQLTQSEDCLTLNIWTPACDDARRPVMVWLHGGAYVNGSGATASWGGHSFAASEDTVLVTINYRLNAFGYLHLNDLPDGSDERGSGNCGLLDQIAALQWVRDRIAGFGGDPGNVTVFGESAGAMSVGVLLGTPTAQGLFARAILQSGAANAVRTREAARAVTEEVCAQLGIAWDAGAVDALRAVPAEQLLAAGSAATMNLAERNPEGGMSFSPVVDGDVLPVAPLQAIADGSAREIALIAGTNVDEMEVMRLLNPVFYEMSDDEVRQLFQAVFADRAAQAQSYYAGVCPGTGGNPWSSALGDKTFLLPLEDLLLAQSAAGGRCWAYLFSFASTAEEGRLGSFHTLEIPFVFRTVDIAWAIAMSGPVPDGAHELADRMHHTWSRFARTGDPANELIPSWPAWDPEQRPTMVFDLDTRLEIDPHRDRRALWATG
jgi:para-nitrobenzyl esterase